VKKCLKEVRRLCEISLVRASAVITVPFAYISQSNINQI